MRFHSVHQRSALADNPRWLAVVVTTIPLLLAVIVSWLPMRVWHPRVEQSVVLERPSLSRTP
jgi:hypothetical protein